MAKPKPLKIVMDAEGVNWLRVVKERKALERAKAKAKASKQRPEPLVNASPALLAFSATRNAAGENCGTGAGGFQPGNTCGKGEGSILKVFGIWNDEVGDDRYSKRLSQTDQLSEKVVKQKLAEVVPGEIWPFPPVVVRRESGPYDLKDGHHRIEVAKRLGIRVIPAVLTDAKAFGHTKPVNTFVEIDNNGDPRIIQPNNETLPPIKVTVPAETSRAKKANRR